MRLLICTQIVDQNDPILGFFHRWIEEYAKHCERVTVVCLKEGVHRFPSNVTVLSLGKEGGISRMKYLLRFYSYIWRERKNYDAVFVHMNQVYVLLGGLLWRLWGKKISLWYVHRSVTPGLRIATALVDHIFTTSPESFRLAFKKRMMLGHGIDTGTFTPQVRSSSDTLRLLTVGRVARTKSIDAMISLVSVLREQNVSTRFSIVGVPVLEADRDYQTALEEQITQLGLSEYVQFEGGVVQSELPHIYQQADVFLNLSSTGSMDKAVLEALACGIPVVTSNVAFKGLLGPYGLFIEQISSDSLAEAVLRARGMDMTPVVDRIRTEHSLSHLIPAIVDTLAA